MDNVTEASLVLNSSNITCVPPLLWTQANLDSRKVRLYVCIIASIIHSIFWLQISFCSSVRQKSMQWIYAYLVTDILILFRFFFSYIVHTISTDCQPNETWMLFFCYVEATIDNYLNMLEVYILLALNLCRYVQIAYNRNVYRVHRKLLIVVHVGIYLISLLFLFIPFLFGWVELRVYISDRCNAIYMNIYIQILNTIFGFALPIILNILVIYASIRHVHLTSSLRQTEHHVTAREKYHRSLVIQFLLFYTIWVALWSPNIIVYQLSINGNNLIGTVRLLSFIDVAIDPIIIAALDVRFWHAWRKVWVHVKNIICFNGLNQGRVRPTITNLNVFTVKTLRLQTTAF